MIGNSHIIHVQRNFHRCRNMKLGLLGFAGESGNAITRCAGNFHPELLVVVGVLIKNIQIEMRREPYFPVEIKRGDGVFDRPIVGIDNACKTSRFHLHFFPGRKRRHELTLQESALHVQDTPERFNARER